MFDTWIFDEYLSYNLNKFHEIYMVDHMYQRCTRDLSNTKKFEDPTLDRHRNVI